MNISKIKYADNIETYQIYGGDAVSVNIEKGDKVEVVNVEGDQECRVLFFDKDGTCAINSINWHNSPNYLDLFLSS